MRTTSLLSHLTLLPSFFVLFLRPSPDAYLPTFHKLSNNNNNLDITKKNV